jgi:hypothetical protein
MELGTGIFLSALVIAVVVLYSITEDRWKWRRFVKRTVFVCLALVLLVVLAGVGAYLYQQIPTSVSRQTEYAGIRLGMSQDEVLYIKGYPPAVLAEDVSESEWKHDYLVIETGKLEKGKSIRDYHHWSYHDEYRNIDIAFNDTRTAVTAIRCFSNDKLGRCPAIAGLEDGDRERKVLQILGSNPQAKFTGIGKSLTYSEWGVQIHLTKEQVYMLEGTSPGYVR